MRRRLLIVDDNAQFRRLAHRLLQSEGYDVVGAAADASEAMTAVARLAPDTVLLDVNLPDGNGFELASRLTRDRPGTLVLLTSTHGRDDFEQLAVESGARGFVSKDDLSRAELERLLA